MGDCSAHNEHERPRPLARTRPRRPRRWRRRTEVKEEFGSAPGEEEAGWAKQTISFFCLFFLFFSRVYGGEGRRKGEPPLGRWKILGDY